MSILCYGARAARCTVLGPGMRCVLWVHGCCFSCEGCIGEGYKSGGFQETTAAEAAEWYLSQEADGLTISGGEPMLQATALAEMISDIRAVRDCGVIVYTGFTYEALLERAEEDPDVLRFLEQIDLLIDGPYIRELDRNQPYRGSENQRLIPLTSRYRAELDSYYHSAAARRTEVRISEGQTLLLGVPGREQAEIWARIKKLGEKHGS